jgi:hypothetical protein
VVVPIRFDEIVGTPSPILILARDQGRTLYVKPDGKGTVAFEPKCPRKKAQQRADPFHVEVAMVKCSRGYGLVDQKGAFVLKPRWEDIGLFQEGRAVIRSRSKSGIIDEAGRFVVPLTRGLNLGSYVEGLSGFSKKGAPHGFFDRQGQVVFKAEVEEISVFHDGLAIARQNRKDGYMDTSGNWAIEPRFHRAHPFRGPLAFVETPVSTDLLEVGYINQAGEVVYKTRFAGFKYPERLVDPKGIGR